LTGPRSSRARDDPSDRANAPTWTCLVEPSTPVPGYDLTVLPPTSDNLRDDATRPSFPWWTDATVGDLRQRLVDPHPAVRGYWLGALLREANSRDVRLYTTPHDLRANWPHVERHLGRERERWAWLLRVEPE
jgi:hypothetical protein